mmetsp:Transcript_4993/g.13261  ORF Transcript_4993/g.13261 Transcript_4993/m.13261 type:complete len:269 (+) Transcript_4993:117-923(+)
MIATLSHRHPRLSRLPRPTIPSRFIMGNSYHPCIGCYLLRCRHPTSVWVPELVLVSPVMSIVPAASTASIIVNCCSQVSTERNHAKEHHLGDATLLHPQETRRRLPGIWSPIGAQNHQSTIKGRIIMLPPPIPFVVKLQVLVLVPISVSRQPSSPKQNHGCHHLQQLHSTNSTVFKPNHAPLITMPLITPASCHPNSSMLLPSRLPMSPTRPIQVVRSPQQVHRPPPNHNRIPQPTPRSTAAATVVVPVDRVYLAHPGSANVAPIDQP